MSEEKIQRAEERIAELNLLIREWKGEKPRLSVPPSPRVCPSCRSPLLFVVRTYPQSDYFVRYLKCKACDERFFTHERFLKEGEYEWHSQRNPSDKHHVNWVDITE